MDGKPYYWEPGRMLVFDDTYLHEVRNDTDEERIVLLLHFEPPMTRLGRLAHQTLVFLLRRTRFVREAKRNYEVWEERFRRQAGRAS